MNFFDNITSYKPPQTQPIINNPIQMNYDINYKINELEQKIKHLEQRIAPLETNKENFNYTEPDNTLYMI